MRNTILAAAAMLALATPAFAQNNVAIPPSDPTIQPSGGYVDPSMAAPTGQLSGAPMGAANMDGPNGNGLTDREQAQNDANGYVDETNGTKAPGDNSGQ